ncbi:Uncharacterised protein [Dorea longicatena]|nr:Uncharacterised protein [Dorea longicatena]
MSASVCLSLTQWCCLWCCNISRSDTITLNIVLTILRADISCKHFQSTFCCCISRYSLTSKLTHHRTDVDNFSVSFFFHSRNNCFRNDEWSIQIYIDYFSELISFHLKHWFSHDDTCIIYKNIDDSNFFIDFSNHCLNLCFICYITYISVCIYTDFFVCSNSFIYFFLTKIIKADCCSCFCISRCDSKSDSIRCSCYECNFTFQ